MKGSWLPRGRFGPKIEGGGRGFLSGTRLAGPWYDGEDGEGEGRRGDDLEIGGAGTGEGEGPPRRSYTLQRSEGYDVDKKQVLVEKEVVGARGKPGSF